MLRGVFPPQDRHRVLAKATEKPADCDQPISHWSISDLAVHINGAGVETLSRSTIWRILDEAVIKPHRIRYWLNSHDGDFESKAINICDLYLAAPRLHSQGELVLSTDEKTGIQALERRHSTKLVLPNLPTRREHEYIRHGTRCLLATLVVPTGRMLGHVTERRTSTDFTCHIREVATSFCDWQRIHWVMDNLNTHWSLELCELIAELSEIPFHPEALKTGAQRRAFLTNPEHQHVIHYTPKHGSWLNQIELFFSTLHRRLLRYGEFVSANDLAARILDYLEYHNQNHARPYRWTYTGKPLTE